MAKISGMGGGGGPYEESAEEAAQWAALNQVMARFPEGTGKVFRFRVYKMRGQETVANNFPGAKKDTRDIFKWMHKLDDARFPNLAGLLFFAKTGTNLHEKGALLPLFVATQQRQPTPAEVAGDFDTDDIVGCYYEAKLTKGKPRTLFVNGADTGKPDTSKGGVNYWLETPQMIVGDDGPVAVPRGALRYDESGLIFSPGAGDDTTRQQRQPVAAGRAPVQPTDFDDEEAPF